MDLREKLATMEKILRELEDLTNSQTSVLKKIGQIEAENINLGDKFLEKRIPDVFGHADDALKEITVILEEYTEVKNKFVKDNKLDEVEPPEGQ